ncbi:MAG: DEAD/DEAH box helicase family protein [Polyangiaceae bacterium]
MKSFSHLVARDSGTRDVLASIGVDGAAATSFDDLFRALNRLDGARGVWARLATYKMTEQVLALPVGRFLREAARTARIEIIFDWCSHRQYGGVTRELVNELGLAVDGQFVRGLRYGGAPNSLFHPKLVQIGVALPWGDELRLSIFGSANVTVGGLEVNTELGVVFADRQPRGTGRGGWHEVDALFDQWLATSKPFESADLDLLADDAGELAEWNDTAIPTALRLRPYQRDAADAILRAWDERYTHRTTNWKGTLLVLPPATGKTLSALYAGVRVLERNDGGGPAVWLSDQPLLAAQAFDEFRRTGFLQRRAIGVLARSARVRRSTASDRIGIDDEASSLEEFLLNRSQAERSIIFTTKGDKKSLDVIAASGPGLVIVDEAHHATASGWEAALKDLKPYLVVGLTGTPYRKAPESDETQRLLRRFCVGPEPWLACFGAGRQARIRASRNEADGRKIAYGRPVENFYRAEFTGTERCVLSVPTFVTVQVVDSGGQRVEVRPRGNSVQRIRFFEDPFSNERDLDELVHDAEIVKGALDAIDADACERAQSACNAQGTVMIFARTIAHCDMLLPRLEQHNLRALALHSRDSRSLEERHRMLSSIRDQAGSVLVCVDMLAEGVDLPNADLLIMTRWTSSERMFWQMIGRGLRGPEVGGTEKVEIVTYDLNFGVTREEELDEGAEVQRVDDALREAFGHNHDHRHEQLPIDFSGPRSRRGDERGGHGIVKRRQGYMLAGDIWDRDWPDGEVFDVIVRRADTGAIVFERSGVRHPRRVLFNLFDQGRRGRNYRFIVTSEL